MRKTITDETLVEMLLVHGGVKGAAVVSGLSERAIYKRLQNPEFRKRYDEMRALSLESTVTSLSDSLTDAVALLRSIVNNATNSPTIRLQAADSLLKHTLRYCEFITLSRRVEAVEMALSETEAV